MSAEVRIRGAEEGPAVVCVNGGQAAAVEGTWSASLEWLVARVAPQFPELRFAEVKYRIKSWNHFDSCLEDARSAIERVDAERTLLLGFSMGGAVAISVADDPRVEGVLGLAPWIPDQALRRAVAGAPSRRDPRLARPFVSGHPRRLTRQFAQRLRARASARRPGHLHARPWRGARDRAPRGASSAASARADVGASRLDPSRRVRQRALNVRRACHTPHPISTSTNGEPVTIETTTNPPTPDASNAHSRNAARAT